MSGDSEPLVSVVMPVRDEAGHIGRALAAVFAQDWPRLEVIVADGGSTDGTREAVLAATEGAPHPLRLLDNPGRTAPCGLNRAIAAARGAIVVRVDGHCEIAPDYVRRCAAHLLAGKAECVGGPLTTVGETPAARRIALAMSSPFGVGDSTFRTGTRAEVLADTVAFPAMRRETLRDVGPYDEELVRDQDDEFSYRLRSRGGRILVAPDVKARYFSRASLTSLFRQYLGYGFFKVRVLQKHPRQMRSRQFVPVLFVASLWLPLLFVPFIPFVVALPATVLAAWTGAAFSAAKLATRGLRDVPGVFLAFAALHLSYGLGFLAGLVRFAPRFLEKGPDLAPEAA